MNVQFDFSINDLLDVTDRTLERSKLTKNQRMRDWFYWAVSGCGGAVLIFLAGRERHALVWLALGGFLAAERYIMRLLRRERLRRWLREQWGGEGPFRCEASIDAAGLHVAQFGSTNTRPWASVSRIVDAATGIEFVSQDESITCIRNRAFPNDAYRGEFLSRARNFHALARQAASGH